MIRKATHADLPRLLELGAMMHAESRFRVLRWNPEKLGRLLEDLIHGEHGFVWVSEKQGDVIGVAVGILLPHWCSDDLTFNDLAVFVVPEHRGGTSAMRLVRAMVTWARTMGAALITLGVSTGVHAEQTGKLFEALGGVCVGGLYDWSVEHVHGR